MNRTHTSSPGNPAEEKKPLALGPLPPTDDPAPQTLDGLSPAQALDLLVKNPVEFVRNIVNDAARMHLADLKEEAELRGAIHAFRKNYPEFDRFEPFILQEVARLIREDADGVHDPWPALLEKAMQHFRGKLSDTLKSAQKEDGDSDSASGPSPADPPRIETAANRTPSQPMPSFTREQISRMSLEDFLKYEDAINTALQARRIR